MTEIKKSHNNTKSTADNSTKPDGKNPPEIGGRTSSKGKDPVRYGDWEKDGRAIDF